MYKCIVINFQLHLFLSCKSFAHTVVGTGSEGHENSPPRKMIPLLKMENDPPFHFGKNNIGK